MPLKSPVIAPTTSIECIALIKPGSALQRHWSFLKPTYAIYRYEKSFDTHELRFGDGSWQRLIPAQFADILLLEDEGEELVEILFD